MASTKEYQGDYKPDIRKTEPFVRHEQSDVTGHHFTMSGIFFGEHFSEIPINKFKIDIDGSSENEWDNFIIDLVDQFRNMFDQTRSSLVIDKEPEPVFEIHTDSKLGISYTFVRSVKIFYTNKKQTKLSL